MPDQASFDLDFRPRSYWGPQNLRTYYGARITGECRRAALVKQIDEYRGSPRFLEASLDAQLRSEIGGLHPWLMGGEYLPPLREGELEIARVVLRSTTMDVTSIRARQSGERIYYSIVDEYPEFGADRFKARPRWSKEPLSMRQVVDIIDANSLIDEPRDMNLEYSSYDEVYDFAQVHSAFYPELERWYDEANEEWRVEREKEWLDENEELLEDEE